MERIEVGRCPKCGRLRDVCIDMDTDGRTRVTLLCRVCQTEPETHTFAQGEGWYLDLGKATPTENEEETPNENPDQSDL